MVANTTNPFLSQKFWEYGQTQQSMTFEGTISKILTLFGVMLLGVFVVFATAINNPSMMMMYWLVGAIGSFILSLVLWLARPENPQMVVLPHAFLEGLFVGGISLFAEMFYPGIALNAGLITTGIVGSMFAFFKFTGFRASRGFNMVLGSAVMAIMFVYLIQMVLFLAGTNLEVPFLHSNGPIGIGISVVIIAIASLTLLSDFTFIENGIKGGFAQKYEWYGAHGLLVSVVWIYFEVLRLLMKLASKR